MDESSLTSLIAGSLNIRVWNGEDLEKLFRVCVGWFRYEDAERWETFSALVLSLNVWRLRHSVVENICPEICTREGQALLEKIEAGCPWRMKETSATTSRAAESDQGGALMNTYQGKKTTQAIHRSLPQRKFPSDESTPLSLPCQSDVSTRTFSVSQILLQNLLCSSLGIFQIGTLTGYESDWLSTTRSRCGFGLARLQH